MAGRDVDLKEWNKTTNTNTGNTRDRSMTWSIVGVVSLLIQAIFNVSICLSNAHLSCTLSVSVNDSVFWPGALNTVILFCSTSPTESVHPSACSFQVIILWIHSSQLLQFTSVYRLNIYSKIVIRIFLHVKQQIHVYAVVPMLELLIVLHLFIIDIYGHTKI